VAGEAARQIRSLMIDLKREPADKLAILQRADHFRAWESLDDKRVCVLCDKTFTGHDVVISHDDRGDQLRCPTRECLSHVHQWVYPGNPLVSETAHADWWQALGNAAKRANAL